MTSTGQPSPAARTALLYITIGALLIVWTFILWMYLRSREDVALGMWYLCYGSLASGLTLLVIGLGVGQIGRSARHADADIPKTAVAVPATPADPTASPVQVAAAPLVPPVTAPLPAQALPRQ